MNNNELYHFGVKGMKWGVRKARTTISQKRQKRFDSYSDDHKTTHDGRNTKQLSNAEIKKRVERLKAETEYMKAQTAYKDAKKGNSWVRKFAQKQFDRQMDRQFDRLIQPKIDSAVDYIGGQVSGTYRNLRGNA